MPLHLLRQFNFEPFKWTWELLKLIYCKGKFSNFSFDVEPSGHIMLHIPL